MRRITGVLFDLCKGVIIASLAPPISTALMGFLSRFSIFSVLDPAYRFLTMQFNFAVPAWLLVSFTLVVLFISVKCIIGKKLPASLRTTISALTAPKWKKDFKKMPYKSYIFTWDYDEHNDIVNLEARCSECKCVLSQERLTEYSYCPICDIQYPAISKQLYLDAKNIISRLIEAGAWVHIEEPE